MPRDVKFRRIIALRYAAKIYDVYTHRMRYSILPAKQRRFVYEQMEIVLGADLAIPMVHGALEAPGTFAAHLQTELHV